MHDAEREWLKSASRAVDLIVEAHGLHRVDPSEQYVVMPLHEGFADAIALSRLPLDLAYSAAEELFEWRLLGRYLKASGQSSVARSHGIHAYRTIVRDAEAAFRRSESYVVFPQGSILGIEVAFFRGAFHLADRTGRPILPVVLTGGADVWQHPYSPNLNFGQTIRMEVTEVEADMKARALAATPGPRRFDPDHDGWWDDYSYEIDPQFPQLKDRVAEHRKLLLTSDL
jgi:1-acyl-sn-glycerol-3-phosphate acyltransferase